MTIGKIINGMKGLEARQILNQVIDEVNNLAALTPQSKFTADATQIANAMDNGKYTGSGSIKSLTEGWWVIPQSNTQVTGRPSGSQGDLIYFTQDVAGGSYAYGFALGKDSQGVDTMWVQYRDGNSWTAWWPVKNLSQLTPTGNIPTELQQEIANLKASQANAIERIKLLETRLGGIFAPNQASFDRAVQAIITPELTNVEKEIASHSKAIRDLESNTLTIDEIKKQLAAEGWGPSAAPHPHSPVFDPSKVELTGGYADDWRDAVHFSTHKVGSPITITKVSDDPHNAVVIMDVDAAKHVQGVTIDGGLPAVWESHAITIGEKQYTAFISPYAFTKHPLDIGIVWS